MLEFELCRVGDGGWVLSFLEIHSHVDVTWISLTNAAPYGNNQLAILGVKWQIVFGHSFCCSAFFIFSVCLFSLSQIFQVPCLRTTRDRKGLVVLHFAATTFGTDLVLLQVRIQKCYREHHDSTWPPPPPKLRWAAASPWCYGNAAARNPKFCEEREILF